MLIVLGMQGAGEVSGFTVIKQSIGTLLAVVLFALLVKAKQVRLPLGQWLKGDKELQVFAVLGLCLGFALISGWFELATALGAFLAGMLVGAAKEMQWVHHTLEPMKVVFVALFFVSVGLLLNLSFLQQNLLLVLTLVMVTLMGKTLLNSLILKGASYSWRESIVTGAMLSQIGGELRTNRCRVPSGHDQRFRLSAGSECYFNYTIDQPSLDRYCRAEIWAQRVIKIKLLKNKLVEVSLICCGK